MCGEGLWGVPYCNRSSVPYTFVYGTLLPEERMRCLGLTLVTNNASEFVRVPGLIIENWANGS